MTFSYIYYESRNTLTKLETLPQEKTFCISQRGLKGKPYSVWVFERLLWPLKPKTPYPGTPNGTLPLRSCTYRALHHSR
jgi:hypothetical protein